MEEKNRFYQIGEDLQKAWNEAWDTMDFSVLSDAISRSVNDAVDGVKHSVKGAVRDAGNSVLDGLFGNASQASGRHSGDDGWEVESAQFRTVDDEGRTVGEPQPAKVYREKGRRKRHRLEMEFPLSGELREEILARLKKQELTTLPDTLVNKHPRGVAQAVLRIVFGALAGAGFAAGGVISLIAGLAGGSLAGGLIGGGISIGLSIFSFWNCHRGAEGAKLLTRFGRYVAALDNNKYAEVKKLSQSVGRSEDFVIRDLREMTITGLFPQGKISEDRKYFLLDDTTAGHYQALLDQKKKEREEEEKRLARENAPERKAMREAVATGRDYIRQIREANEAIPGEEITKKLDRLEEVCELIFTHVEERPETLGQLRRFMEYYLPMTMKLVNAYRDLDGQPLQTDNITTAKKEIEDSLDTINNAFLRLYDDLFADKAMDVSTDISVLQTLLAQEGLTEDALEKDLEGAGEIH